MSAAFRFCLVVSLLLAAPAAAELSRKPAEAPSSPYTVTVIPYYSPEKIWAKFSPFVGYLDTATGHSWQLKLYPDHDSLLNALCSGEVSFALLGPVPMARAMDRCKADIAAVALGRKGKPFYRSLVLTADPAVSSLAGLKGRRFGLFKASTAAHIFPLKMLRNAGLRDDDIVPVYYESQDHIMNALLSREISGAGVKQTLYEKFKDQPLRVLAMSKELPGFAFAVAPGVAPDVRRAFVAALLRLHPLIHERDRRLMQDWDDEIRNGFIVPPAEFRGSVLDTLAVTREILHEPR